jgi:hypothetical protein
MVKTANAFAEQPDIKANIKELKLGSTGADLAAQLRAIEDFINQGYAGRGCDLVPLDELMARASAIAPACHEFRLGSNGSPIHCLALVEHYGAADGNPASERARGGSA